MADCPHPSGAYVTVQSSVMSRSIGYRCMSCGATIDPPTAAPPVSWKSCDVCWDSHGCELPEGHSGPLHCCLYLNPPTEPCSLILWSDGEGWVRWDDGERVGPVRAFHALAENPWSVEAEIGAPK